MKENRSAQNLGFMRRDEGSLRLTREGGRYVGTRIERKQNQEFNSKRNNSWTEWELKHRTVFQSQVLVAKRGLVRACRICSSQMKGLLALLWIRIRKSLVLPDPESSLFVRIQILPFVKQKTKKV
jgi:hypothetical protein